MLKYLGPILIVAGTAIGAGMLALPISTGLAGFFPSMLLFILSWFFMMVTAFCLLEVSLWMEEGVDLLTMIDKTLGKKGRFLGGCFYLLLLYCLTCAYIRGAASLTEALFAHFFAYSLPLYLSPLPNLFFFGSFVYLGSKAVDRVNQAMMFGLMLTYCFLLFFVPQYVNFSYLQHSDYSYFPSTLALSVTSFGFHVVIPSLVHYLKSDLQQLKKVLFLGSLIPLLVYVIWQFLILGVLPLEGNLGIIDSYRRGLIATEPLQLKLQIPSIALAANFFSFFSISTSFLGVSLSLMHFLSDAIHIRKTFWGNFQVCLLTFLPPLAFVVSGSQGFYLALQYAGIFVAMLLGLLPVCMVWKGRYKQMRSGYRVPGGKALLLVTALFFIIVLLSELLRKYF